MTDIGHGADKLMFPIIYPVGTLNLNCSEIWATHKTPVPSFPVQHNLNSFYSKIRKNSTVENTRFSFSGDMSFPWWSSLLLGTQLRKRWRPDNIWKLYYKPGQYVRLEWFPAYNLQLLCVMGRMYRKALQKLYRRQEAIDSFHLRSPSWIMACCKTENVIFLPITKWLATCQFYLVLFKAERHQSMVQVRAMLLRRVLISKSISSIFP